MIVPISFWVADILRMDFPTFLLLKIEVLARRSMRFLVSSSYVLTDWASSAPVCSLSVSAASLSEGGPKLTWRLGDRKLAGAAGFFPSSAKCSAFVLRYFLSFFSVKEANADSALSGTCAGVRVK